MIIQSRVFKSLKIFIINFFVSIASFSVLFVALTEFNTGNVEFVTIKAQSDFGKSTLLKIIEMLEGIEVKKNREEIRSSSFAYLLR